MGFRKAIATGTVAAFLLLPTAAAGYESELLSPSVLQSAAQGKGQQNDRDGPAYRLHQHLGKKDTDYFVRKAPDGKIYVGTVSHVCGEHFHFEGVKIFEGINPDEFFRLSEEQKKKIVEGANEREFYGVTGYGPPGAYRFEGANRPVTDEVVIGFERIVDDDIIGGKKK
jgi:hypothetical protein